MKKIVILLTIATMGFAHARTAVKLKETTQAKRNADRVQTTVESARDAKTDSAVSKVAPFNSQAAAIVKGLTKQNVKTWDVDAQISYNNFMTKLNKALTNGSVPSRALNQTLLEITDSNLEKAQELKEEMNQKCRV